MVFFLLGVLYADWICGCKYFG